MTFEKFLILKNQWLRNMHLTWLIQGHLSQESALSMASIAEEALNYQPVRKSDIDFSRLVKLSDRTIYNFEQSNHSADNPNSACDVRFAHQFDVDKDQYAVIKVLDAFLSEPTFNTLRTQEQLGYIVRSSL